MTRVAGVREFVFHDRDFERIRDMIYRRAGIALSPAKKDMVYSRLARRLRARGLSAFSDYLALLEQGDAQEWEAFINALTTNLTAFFREPHHFEILARHVAAHPHCRPVRLWCAACSTGEEAYSLAITMMEVFASYTPPVSILATDVDTHALAKGRAGVYAQEQVAKLSAERVRRFFVKGPATQPGSMQVRDELKALIRFVPLNLLDRVWSVRGPFDAIFCRNVMIYFDKDTQYRILQKFAPMLAPHGLLFAGHAENLTHAADLFQPCGRTVYAPVTPGRRPGRAQPAIDGPLGRRFSA
ncbi:chemotaxis protein CheR [Pelomicrobium methylotrophicum]|uniref:Chemotaxis protein methyltransferase n=1 Tax=Pelomicrobium methylotrophicum TaxID=2602750 RepID=A0A5C7EUC5_9PROT|nr:CheR family methyltransferase [Pelomicrobium methylotrophicum]TXF11828.1 chemotaxis protein CheR [Pelomicrobium methylotrophicum]